MYVDWWDWMEELTTEQRGILLTAVYAIQTGEDVPDMDKETRMAYKMIRNQLVRDKTKYEETIEKRREAGRKGGIASGKARRSKNPSKTVENPTETKQNEANEADNVYVYDNDNDNVYVNVNEHKTDPDQTDGQTDGFLSLGVNGNVRLTPNELNEVKRQYQNATELIDRVSLWLPKAKYPNQNHLQLLHKFALNDGWPKKPKPEKPPGTEPKRDTVPMPDEVRDKITKLFG